jgi:predicted DCC family thiol-disulfide oxidoreductase YuxK
MARWSYAQLPLPFWFTAALTYFSVWYEVLFTPLVLWRRTRNMTLWAGILFHLGIYSMIEVGWFSFYTIAMYGAWIPDRWWQRRFVGRSVAGGAPSPANAYRVYYDTICPICQRSRRTLERLDWRRRLDFRDIHDRATMEREVPGVSYRRALREMIVVAPSGKVTGGFDAFRTLAWAIPLWWPLLPLLYVPGVPFLGRRIYRWVARNRYRLLACDNDICSLHLRALSQDNLDEAEIQRLVAQAKQHAPQ